MCGVAGILDLKGMSVDISSLKRLCAQLSHRGPDEEGYHVDREIALGQRRLSIIDLAGGRQPMCNEDGTLWITFNGEIYNFQELKPWLEERGHRFSSNSDTEVILHAYEELGPECLQRLRGMFAFALWDEKKQLLFMARDRVGKKPLFYTQTRNQFLFASELQALLAHPDVRRETDVSALDEYLTYGYIPAPKTAFKNIYKVPPAHYLILTKSQADSVPGEIKVVRYWQLAYTPKRMLTEEQATEELMEVLTEAVKLRMIADVPLGALLSGGIDSSIIVALMSQLSSRPVKTFSIGFEEQEFNELPYARAVAERYGTEHHELIVRPSSVDLLPMLVRHYGEPFADSSAIPSYSVASLTRQHVKVALNGDGGDESFAGYERYLGSTLADRFQYLPSFLLRGVSKLAGWILPRSLSRRNRLNQARRFFEAASLPPSRRYLHWMTCLTPAQKQTLYTPEFRNLLQGSHAENWLVQEYEALQHEKDALDTLLALDVQSYLPYDLLVKMDIASMACSLEARSPFLDHKVMEFAAQLPSRFKIKRTTLKYLLKKAAVKLLPPENLRRRKMGFGVSVGTWMQKELRPLLEEVLLSSTARTRAYLQPALVRQMAEEHWQGKQDHSSALWALLWLELWHREFSL